MSTNDTPFAHRVARPTKSTEPESAPVRPETITPFAHTASKKITRYVLEPMPLCDADLTCEEETENFGAMPLTDDDLGEEQETSASVKRPLIKPIATRPLITPTPTQPAPVIVTAPSESSAMRQTLVALVAFIATTLVLLLAVVVWKSVLGK